MCANSAAQCYPRNPHACTECQGEQEANEYLPARADGGIGGEDDRAEAEGYWRVQPFEAFYEVLGLVSSVVIYMPDVPHLASDFWQLRPQLFQRGPVVPESLCDVWHGG